MDSSKFADAMENIGFRADEVIDPVFELTKNDLDDPVFKKSYTKVVGLYSLESVWLQEGEIALWATNADTPGKLYPFHKEEVDYLVRKSKFQHRRLHRPQ